MVGLWLVSLTHHRMEMMIAEQLLIRDHPVAAHQVKHRRKTHRPKDRLCNFLAIFWRLLVKVVHLELLNAVKPKD